MYIVGATVVKLSTIQEGTFDQILRAQKDTHEKSATQADVSQRVTRKQSDE